MRKAKRKAAAQPKKKFKLVRAGRKVTVLAAAKATKAPAAGFNYAAANKRAATKHKKIAAAANAASAPQLTAPVEMIRIGERHRKEYGDLVSLARSINDRGGLLQPIVVKPLRAGKFDLIAGERRLRAWPLTRFSDRPIPIVVFDVDSILLGERDENTERKNFTHSEAVAIMREAEPIERARAIARQREHGFTAPGRKAGAPPAEKGRALDKVAKATGIGRTSLEKAAAIVEAAEQDPERFGKLVEAMDRGGVNGPFKRLLNMRQGDKLRAEPPALPGQGPYRTGVIDLPWAAEPTGKPPSETGRGYYKYATMNEAECVAFGDKVVPLLHPEGGNFWFWTTNFHLVQDATALRVLDAWSAKAEAAGLGPIKRLGMRTWGKDVWGNGQTFRGQTEHVILCAFGKNPPKVAEVLSTLLEGKAGGEHSEKPVEFYRDVERATPASRYFELFARRTMPENWDGFGDQVGTLGDKPVDTAETRATSAYQAEMGFKNENNYRSTPAGQSTVADLVKPGMVVTTSYGSGPYRVVEVSGPFIHKATRGVGRGRIVSKYPHYSLCLCEVDAKPNKKTGAFTATAWINEVVAVDGRLMLLFEANSDEVFIQPPPTAPAIIVPEKLAARLTTLLLPGTKFSDRELVVLGDEFGIEPAIGAVAQVVDLPTATYDVAGTARYVVKILQVEAATRCRLALSAIRGRGKAKDEARAKAEKSIADAGVAGEKVIAAADARRAELIKAAASAAGIVAGARVRLKFAVHDGRADKSIEGATGQINFREGATSVEVIADHRGDVVFLTPADLAGGVEILELPGEKRKPRRPRAKAAPAGEPPESDTTASDAAAEVTETPIGAGAARAAIDDRVLAGEHVEVRINTHKALYEALDGISRVTGAGSGYASYPVPHAWAEDLAAVEAALAELTPDDLLTFADGDEAARLALRNRSPALWRADGLLCAFARGWWKTDDGDDVDQRAAGGNDDQLELPDYLRAFRARVDKAEAAE